MLIKTDFGKVVKKFLIVYAALFAPVFFILNYFDFIPESRMQKLIILLITVLFSTLLAFPLVCINQRSQGKHTLLDMMFGSAFLSATIFVAYMLTLISFVLKFNYDRWLFADGKVLMDLLIGVSITIAYISILIPTRLIWTKFKKRAEEIDVAKWQLEQEQGKEKRSKQLANALKGCPKKTHHTQAHNPPST